MDSHYTVIRIHSSDAMDTLRARFPKGVADSLNVCLFSTSGVHGTYQTIEEEEKEPGIGVTFLIMEPRRVRLLYGNVTPKSADDFRFLKLLRKSSHKVLSEIGIDYAPPTYSNTASGAMVPGGRKPYS